MKAVDAGVDGLIVEGGEGGGFKGPRPVSSLVLVPLIRSRVDVPIIAAGGIADGVSMAAAFALGAEGVQMGTRMVSAAESPVHENWKLAITGAAETDTVFLKSGAGPCLRALRTATTEALEAGEGEAMATLAGGVKQVYFDGDLAAGLALTGQVAGRIDEVKTVADIITDTVREYAAAVEDLAAQLDGS
jgi:enoyl-[acyl-carrier protein] reductase II